MASRMGGWQFQSSPVPEDGCNLRQSFADDAPCLFQSSPVPEDGCNCLLRCRCYRLQRFQSSPVPEDGCNFKKFLENPRKPLVSILTRPEGRVQPACKLVVFSCALFQSSPVPEDGCNSTLTVLSPTTTSFNPHPSRRTGATVIRLTVCSPMAVSILTRPGGRVQRHGVVWIHSQIQFQSSPVPEDGCNEIAQAECVRLQRFNPHPSRRTGATDEAGVQRQATSVSILTRPGGRVQHARWSPLQLPNPFQSSPVPEDGCNSAGA